MSMILLHYEDIKKVASANARYLATGGNWPKEAVEAAATMAAEMAASEELRLLSDAQKVGLAVASALNAHRPEAPVDYALPSHSPLENNLKIGQIAASIFMVAAGALAVIVLAALWWL